MPTQLAPNSQLLNGPANFSECRVYERHSCELPGLCHAATAGHSSDQKWSATVRDISQGGIRLDLSRRFERGAGLVIELPDDAAGGSRTFFAKVVYTRSVAGSLWSHGCQFIKPLSADELQQLRQNSALKPTKAQVLIHLVDGKGNTIQSLVTELPVPDSWPLAAGKTVNIHVASLDNSPSSLRLRVIRCEQSGSNWTVRGQLLNSD